MSIKKEYLKNSAKCRVTFKIPGEFAGEAGHAAVVGEFNGWDSTASPMKKLKNGSFSLAVNLPAGRTYQFRYLLDENKWISDSEADGYERCAFGDCDNSVLNL